ncbi:MAG: oligosaccharide flippase family protein [Gemmatimonadales bacterium]
MVERPPPSRRLSDPSLFQTDGVRAELPQRTVRSGAIAAVSRFGQIALQLGSAVVLARLLTPADFGIQAMVLALAILFNSVANLGLQTVIIQREVLDHAEASAMFHLAVRTNVLVCGAMAVAGAALAVVYRQPAVTWVAAAWATVIYLAATAAVHEALLKRQLKFGMVWSAHLAATVASVGAAIVAAASGAGHWALLIQIAVMELGRAATVWLVSGWKPGRPTGPPGPSVREMRDHWLRIGGFRTLSMAGDHLDRVVAGIVGGPTALGLYETAKRWAWMPFMELYLSLTDVATSSLSRAQTEPARYRKYFEYGLLAVLTLAVPTMIFVGTNAAAFLLTLFGPRWLGAEPFLELMCVGGLAAAISRPMQWLFLSRGETRRQVRWSAITTPVMIAGVATGAWWGALGVAVGFVSAIAILALPTVWFAVATTPVRATDVARAVGRPVIASLAASVVVQLPGATLTEMGPLAALSWSAAIFAPMYALGWLILPGGRRAAMELLGAVRAIRARRGSATPSPR